MRQILQAIFCFTLVASSYQILLTGADGAVTSKLMTDYFTRLGNINNTNVTMDKTETIRSNDIKSIEDDDHDTEAVTKPNLNIDLSPGSKGKKRTRTTMETTTEFDINDPNVLVEEPGTDSRHVFYMVTLIIIIVLTVAGICNEIIHSTRRPRVSAHCGKFFTWICSRRPRIAIQRRRLGVEPPQDLAETPV